MTRKIRHTEKCRERQKAWEERHARYMAAWPHHCRTCHGFGEFRGVENQAPHGAGYWPMEYVELCPRCGHNQASNFWEDGEPCSICEWKYGDPGEPEQPECSCWSLPLPSGDIILPLP